MSGRFGVGAVLYHLNFRFEDGSTRNKYLVVLGAKHPGDCLCVLTTTRQWKMKAEEGCHHTPRTHFFLPGAGTNFFQKDTWLVLSKPVVISYAKMLERGMRDIIQIRGSLDVNITREIINCLKESKDISDSDMQLLQA